MDPSVENEDLEGSDGMDTVFLDLANAIPGIDEAMSFAEMLKYVVFSSIWLYLENQIYSFWVPL